MNRCASQRRAPDRGSATRSRVHGEHSELFARIAPLNQPTAPSPPSLSPSEGDSDGDSEGERVPEGRERRRFIGREKLDVNRNHEPVGIPLNRPSGTFSPTGGEGRDEGGAHIQFKPRTLAKYAEAEQWGEQDESERSRSHAKVSNAQRKGNA